MNIFRNKYFPRYDNDGIAEGYHYHCIEVLTF